MNTPLPPGWTAQYDPNQRRYFFINHSTQTTSWDDPRFTRKLPSTAEKLKENPYLLRNLKGSYPSVPDSIIADKLRQSNNDIRTAGALIDDWVEKQRTSEAANHDPRSVFGEQHRKPEPLNVVADDDDDDDFDDDLHEVVSAAFRVDEDKVREIKADYPTCSESYIREILQKNMGLVGMATTDIELAGHVKKSGDGPSIKPNEYMSRKIKGDYSDVDKDIIDQQLVACRNVESDARARLAQMGYKTTQEREAASTQATPNRIVTSLEATGVTEAEKQRLLSELSADFVGTSQMVVEMVLETVAYDEENARGVLRTMGAEVKGHRKQSKTSDTASPKKSSSKASTPSKGAAKASASSKAVVDAEKNRLHSVLSTLFPDVTHATIEAALKTCDYQENRTRALLTRANHPTSSPRKSPTKTPSKSPSPPKTPKSVTMVTGGGPTTSFAAEWPQISGQVFRHNTVARGPNHDLHKGPNPGYLLTDYVQCRGPNLTLRHGPRPENYRGSTRATGPDISMRRGSEPTLHHGPSSENLLVTAI